jgi:membrane protein implicated in regulation of membrane protease activity
MNKKALLTLILGLLSLGLLGLSQFNDTLSFLTFVFALIGSFIGIWFIFSVLFRTIDTNGKNKLYILIGTTASLFAFAFGRFGFLLTLWLPGAVVGIFLLRSVVSSLNKTGNLLTGALQDKIYKMEDEVAKQSKDVKL